MDKTQKTILLFAGVILVSFCILATLFTVYNISQKPGGTQPSVAEQVNAQLTQISLTEQILPNKIPQPTSTDSPKLDSSCQFPAQEYLASLRLHLLEFDDTIKVAGSTPRISLGPIIQDLQKIKRDVENKLAPSCTQGASNLIINGMDKIINAFIEFMGDVYSNNLSQEGRQGFLDITNGINQLSALSSGRTTPLPEKLPTKTPLPTPIPTPIPLPVGSSMNITDTRGNPWEIRVSKILVADTLKSKYSDTLEGAVGRFAILFMEVTNKGMSSETFSSYLLVDVTDASGQRYKINDMAGLLVEELYEVDMCAEINPNETKTCMSVYDISKQSSYYMLVPGELADSYAPRILIAVP